MSKRFNYNKTERDKLLKLLENAKSSNDFKEILHELIMRSYRDDIQNEEADKTHEEIMNSMSWEDFN